jgi:mannose-6-phosphate isomerase
MYEAEVQEGEIYEIPAGRVHAIGKGILLAEIQQTSDITYRIYDWNRTDAEGNPRELHTDLALDAIDFKIPAHFETSYTKTKNSTNKVNETPYFSTNYLKLDKNIERDYTLLDSFVIYMLIDGECSIEDEFENKEILKKGETILIPNELKNITIKTDNAEILEIYM